MAYSYKSYIGDGSTRIFGTPPYMEKGHIHLYVDEVDTPFEWNTVNTIIMAVAPVSGAIITVKRETPIDDGIVDFTNGSLLNEETLDLLALFNLYTNQETIDKVSKAVSRNDIGVLDMEGGRIVNVGSPIEDNDATNRNSITSLTNIAISQAEAARDAAVSAKDSAIANALRSEAAAVVTDEKVVEAASFAALAEDYALQAASYTTSLLPNLQTVSPALVLPFDVMTNLPGVVDFTRASSGTRLSASGIIKTEAINVPRFDFNGNGEPLGLLVEAAVTRLNTIAAAPTAPENVTVTAQAYTISFYGTGSMALSGVHTATVVGTGAFPTRTSYTFTPTAGTLTLTPSGDVQHLQLEAGTVPTSPILGEGSQVARAPDMATVDVSGIEWNENEGTIFCEGYAPAVLSATTRFLFQADASGDASHRVYATMANNAVFAAVIASNTSQALLSLGTVNAGDRLRMAISFKENAFRGVLNGWAVVEDLSGVLPVGMSVLRIGNNHAGNLPWQSGIRHVAYFPRALTDAQLQAMTL